MELDIYKNYLRIDLQSKYKQLLDALQVTYNRESAMIRNQRNLTTIAKNIQLKTLYQKTVDKQAELKRNYDLEYNAISTIQYPVLRTNGAVKRAVLVGINYVETPYELHGCINDVMSIKRHLNDIGFHEENIQLLTDYTPDAFPTKSNILAAFTQLLQNAQPNDLLCFFYSGHGSNIRDMNGDEKDGLDEVIVSKDLQYISDDELRSIIRQHLKVDNTLFAMFDSCFSGTILDLKYNYNNRLNIDSRYSDTIGNVIVLSGCTDQQTSAESVINNVNQGALSWAFQSACISSTTWRQFLANINRTMNNGMFTQTPQLSSGKLINLDSPFFV